MKLGNTLCHAALLAPLLVCGCGASTGDNLFGSSSPTGNGAGGVTGPNYLGGGGGQLPLGGGPPGSGSTFGTGGFAGGASGNAGSGGASGAAGFSNGGFSGASGSPPDGGGPGGSGGGRDAGTPPADGPFNPLNCDFSGTWASYVAIDVTWPGTAVLTAGDSKLQQWNLTHEVQAPLSTTVTAHTKPCGIFLPDLQTTIFVLFEKFGIRFPNPLFDKGTIPETTFNFVADISSNPITFKTDPFAIVIGADVAEPITAPWPTVSSMTLRDDDHDGNPGITVIPVTGNGYYYPPANLLTGDSADLVYIATRTVSALSGTLSSCDKIEADVTIQTVNGKPGIDSTVVGCHRVGTNANPAGPCAPDEASFVDGARPQFTPKGPGHMTIVRVPESTTCADVRQRFPLQ